jgi:hypothetical protein
MPLAEPADRRIAAHRADGVEVERDQAGARAHSSGHRSRLAARMAAADHQNVEPVHAAPLIRGAVPVKAPRCFT